MVIWITGLSGSGKTTLATALYESVKPNLSALVRIDGDDDLILVTALGYPHSGNRMNLIQTHAVSDLRESLGWKK